jgi:beta-lactam-binding protein with PASTA domain
MLLIDEPAVPVMEAGSIAAPWVKAIFTDLVQYYGILPDTTTATATVPDVTGETGQDAVYHLEQAGFATNLIDDEEAAVVISQYPAAGETVSKGSIVIVYTTMTTFNAQGVYKEQVSVPNLLEKRRQDAFDRLAELGLVLAFDKTQCTGQIISQSIEPDTLVDPGTTIYVEFPTPTPSPTPDPAQATPEPEE